MQNLEQGWIINTNKKLIFKKSIPIISWLITSLGFGKTSMNDLWRMNQDAFRLPELMKFNFPLDHDNFLKPKKYPFYYRLINGWRIDKKSIKFLKNGPLFSEDGTRVLVSENIFFQTLLKTSLKFLSTLFILVIPTLFAYYQFYKSEIGEKIIKYVMEK